MLRRLVGGRSRAAVLDEGRNAAQNNRTAESDLFAEFFRGSNPSLPLAAVSAGKEAPLDLKVQSPPNEGQCKYTATWQRARAKLKSRLMITKLRKELNLFGSNRDNASHNSAPTSVKGTASLIFRKCILPPRSLFLDVWQLILALSILYTATVFPFRMAFIQNAGQAIIALDLAVDMCFVVDVGINLSSAYVNADFELVTSRRRICRRYLRGWMLFDVLSCLPVTTNELWFGETANHGSYSELLRLFRLPRLYRLVKIINILDVNSPSGQNRVLERCKDVLKLDHGSVKLLTTVLMISIATHIAACFLYLEARVSNFDPDTWVERLGEVDVGKTSHYISCVYWAVTTLATVGYGDINGFTVTERLLCICWMFCGIYFFSFAIGSLTSFLSGINTK